MGFLQQFKSRVEMGKPTIQKPSKYFKIRKAYSSKAESHGSSDSPDPVVKSRVRNGSSPFRHKDHQPLNSFESVPFQIVSLSFFSGPKFPRFPTAFPPEPAPKSTAIGASNGPTCFAKASESILYALVSVPPRGVSLPSTYFIDPYCTNQLSSPQDALEPPERRG